MKRLRWIGLVCLALLLVAEPVCADAEPAREAFEVDGRQAFIIAPDKPAETKHGKPWVWYAPTLIKRHPSKTEAWMIQRLHKAGIALAGVDVGESMGNPAGRAIFQKLYIEMTTKRGYSTKPVLLARSRGGLMLYNWAVEHPKCVGGIAGIYPVCNLASWPGLKRAAPAYKLTPEQLEAELHKHNPVDRLEPLAKAKVPLFHLQGDNDRVVPHDQNTALLAKRYTKLGGPIEVEIIKGGGHDMKRHWFESQTLTDFMIRHALGQQGGKDAGEGSE